MDGWFPTADSSQYDLVTQAGQVFQGDLVGGDMGNTLAVMGNIIAETIMDAIKSYMRPYFNDARDYLNSMWSSINAYLSEKIEWANGIIDKALLRVRK